MTTKLTDAQIAKFKEKFGQPHLDLACHAAFSMALTPDLLYRLWAHFRCDIHDQPLHIPWVAVSDILLAPFCGEVGIDLYEIDADIRDALLNQLKTNLHFGPKRLQELANFLLAYHQISQIHSDDPDLRELAQVQRWTALAHTNADKVVPELAHALLTVPSNHGAEWVRLAALLERLQLSSREAPILLHYAKGMAELVHGEPTSALRYFRQLPGGDRRRVKVAGVTLPIPEEVQSLLQKSYHQRLISKVESAGRNLWSWGGKAGRRVLATSLLVTAAFWGWRQVGTSLEALEIYTRDRMVRLNADAPPDPRLLVVGVTEADIKRYRYPLPDGVVAEALSRIVEAQPRAVGLNIFRDIPQGEGREDLLQVLQQHPQIVVVCTTDIEMGYPPPQGLTKERLGFSNLLLDPGGVVRRALLGVGPSALPDDTENPCQNPAEPMFSLGLQLARQYLAEVGIPLTETDSDEIQFGAVVLQPLGPSDGGYQRADTRGYQILLQYRSGDRIAEQVTLSQLLEGQIKADQLRDRIVLVGYVAESFKDLLPTPYSGGQNNNRSMPAVVIHAQLTSQILRTVLDGEPIPWFWPQGAELGWVWVWALVGGAIASSLRHPLALGGAIGLGIGVCAGVGYLAFLQGGWVLVVTPALALGITAAGVIVVDRNS